MYGVLLHGFSYLICRSTASALRINILPALLPNSSNPSHHPSIHHPQQYYYYIGPALRSAPLHTYLGSQVSITYFPKKQSTAASRSARKVPSRDAPDRVRQCESACTCTKYLRGDFQIERTSCVVCYVSTVSCGLWMMRMNDEC